MAQRVAGQSVISSSLNTAINGGCFKDNLTNALLANIGSQVQAEGANLIGDNGQVLDIPGRKSCHSGGRGRRNRQGQCQRRGGRGAGGGAGWGDHQYNLVRSEGWQVRLIPGRGK
ncbi:TPA: DUF637 domain-containing protein [Serratia marcescens]